jgi:hypothetical protein
LHGTVWARSFFFWRHTAQRRMKFSLPVNTVPLSGFGCLLSPSILCFFLCTSYSTFG